MSFVKNNNLQFAVVREDPEIEAQIIRENRSLIKNILLIGSGGCTALTLRNEFPDIKQYLIEPNGSQINHIKLKEFLIETKDQDQLLHLNQKGNFESLFRLLRKFIYEFIIEEELLRKVILSNDKRKILEIINHKYWHVAFELYFSDAILNAMFGPSATQHAGKGSYSAYFRNVFEKGLCREDCSTNYFLHHLLFSNYDQSNLPIYVYSEQPEKFLKFEYCNITIEKVESFSEFDFMSFSNIFDWSNQDYVHNLAVKIKNEAKKGSIILFRQLNNPKNFKELFSPEFEFNDNLETSLLLRDRSLFYSQLNIGTKG